MHHQFEIQIKAVTFRVHLNDGHPHKGVILSFHRPTAVGISRHVQAAAMHSTAAEIACALDGYAGRMGRGWLVDVQAGNALICMSRSPAIALSTAERRFAAGMLARAALAAGLFSTEPVPEPLLRDAVGDVRRAK